LAWWVTHILLILISSFLAGYLQGYTAYAISFWLTNGENLVSGISGIIMLGVTVTAIAHQGFTLKALGSVGIAFAVAAIVAGAGTGAGTISGGLAFVVTASVASAASVAFSGAEALALNVAGGVAILGITVGAFVGVEVVATTVANAYDIDIPMIGTVAIAILCSSLSLLFAIYVVWHMRRFDPRFENLRHIGLFFSAIGGTTFSGADLTGATFAHTCLKSTNFADSLQQPTNLTRVRWHHTQKLDRARLGSSILQDYRVRLLLTSLNGNSQDFSNANLRGANLAGARLHQANLKAANLNGATLEAAELHSANLTEAQCLGTDFTAAHLTGACLEAWNIDETTILKDIDCLHVFLKEQPDARGDRERRPHYPDKDFAPGDFEKLFKEMPDTVQILIRNGVNPESFKAALQQLMATYPTIDQSAMQGLKRKGNDWLLTLQVTEGTDKGKIEQIWEEVYEARLQAATVRAQLEAEQRRADDVKEVALRFSQFIPAININNMNNPINTGDGSFYAGGDVNLSASTLNLGEISGQVSNQIDQLPDVAPESGRPNLKDLLAQLKEAIEADAELSEVEKKEALGEVAKLAEAGSNPQANAMQRMAKRAADNLKSIAEPLTEASNLAEACKNLLPLILPLFALL
jgi:uncharacterized protein YjbI with pentapeptide repeats